MIPKCITDEKLSSLKWTDYIGDRLITTHPSGFRIIVPKDSDPAISLFCPLCNCILSTGEDVSVCRELGCCEHCKERWYYSNKEKWSSGWRPKIESRCEHKKTVLINLTKDRKSTRLNSSHVSESRMPSSA